MAELTSDGYIRKRLSEYITQIQEGYIAIFGENFDLTSDSPDGQLIGIFSEIFSNLDQALEDVYNAFDPQSSQEVSLSKLVLLNGVTRKEATYSTSDVNLTGLAGVTVPAGSVIKTNDTEEEFTLDAEIVLTGGTDAGTATAVNKGAITALTDTLVVIATPIAGWSTVTNPTDATEGQNEETDEELRIRREQSTAISAKSIVDAIYGALIRLDDVTGVAVLENDTSTDVDSQITLAFDDDFVASNTIDMDINGAAISQVTYTASHVNTIALLDAAILAHTDVDAVLSSDTSPGSEFVIDGVSGVTLVITNVAVALGVSQSDYTITTDEAPVLAHGIHAIVDGGGDDEIAETIFETKSAGCQTTGITEETVIDDQGQNKLIRFSRPTDTDIEIQVDVTTNADFPGDGDQQIKDALVEYGSDELNIGDDVIHSRLYTPINTVPGHSVDVLLISKLGETLAADDIPIAINEIAMITDANITVNVT